MANAEARTPKDKASLNAESTSITFAAGSNTNGILNQHPSAVGATCRDGSAGSLPFRVGVSEDCNKRCRRTMEDSHAFVYDFADVAGQGFFGVFDGHAGKHAAEWCGQNFHKYLLKTLELEKEADVPDLMNKTFHAVDSELSASAAQQGTTSGCTAVVAFLRLEGEDGRPLKPSQVVHSKTEASSSESEKRDPAGGSAASESDGLWGRLSRKFEGSGASKSNRQDASDSVETSGLRRVLYTANVGDARAVLCRGGTAVRLTYDHKGSDAQEVKRITDAGGFVMNHRVNGVLAVTRSLGDSAMKEFVVGSPYTTETVLSQQDTFLIVACDGLWDVTEDQDAVDLIVNEEDPQAASQKLLQHALSNFSTDNTSVMVVRFGPPGATMLTGETHK